MNCYGFDLCGAALRLLPSGAVWWPEANTLVVSDLHLGKSERIARRSGQMLPPYETRDTLARLEADLDATRPGRVVCLGDSFDDDAARAGLEEAGTRWIARLQAGRDWIWISGNHDPAPQSLGGAARATATIGPLTLRHVAAREAAGEVSGHYHPKARLSLRGRSLSRPCLLLDARRAILPAYGTYTGGLDWTAPVLAELFPEGGRAILTGATPCAVPLPARARA